MNMKFWKPKPSTTAAPELTEQTLSTPEAGCVSINATNVTMVTNNYFADGCRKSRGPIRLVVTSVSITDKPQTKERKMFALTIRTGQKATLKISPLDRFGLVEALDGDVTAEVVSGDAIAEVLPGNELRLTASLVPGTSTIKLTADAQEGEGKDVITETIELTVQHENAVVLNLAVKSIEDRPSTEPPPAVPTTGGTES